MFPIFRTVTFYEIRVIAYQKFFLPIAGLLAKFLTIGVSTNRVKDQLCSLVYSRVKDGPDEAWN